MRRLILLILCLPIIIHAQDWQSEIDSFDPNRWPSETMLNVKVLSAGQSVRSYTVAAYIDSVLRGYNGDPREVRGEYIYTLRVKGDEADKGKPIKLCIIDNATKRPVSDADVTVSTEAVWTGETESYPSNPVVVVIGTVEHVASINTVTGIKLYRQDYTDTGLDLTPYYTVEPDNALNKDVDMALTLETKRKGELENRAGRWIFTPYDNCKGDVDIRIMSKDNTSARASLVITWMAHVDYIETSDSPVTVGLGGSVNLSEYFTVMPRDADCQDVTFEYDSRKVSISSIGSEHRLEAHDIGTTEVTVRPVDNPDAAKTLTIKILGHATHFDVCFMPNSDDMPGPDGEILTLRNGINTRRIIRITPMPAGSYMDRDLLQCTASFSGSDYPATWQSGILQLSDDSDAEGARYTFCPLLAGEYTIRPYYDGVPMTDTNGNPVELTLPVSFGYKLGIGWNWITAWPVSQGPRLSNVLSDRDMLEEARTQTYFLINDPELGYFSGFADENGDYFDDFTLDSSIDHGHFRIRIKEDIGDIDGRVYVNGVTDLTGADWRLTPGWNWINSPCIYDLPLTTLEQAGYEFNADDVIKGSNGFCVYVNGRGWTGSLGTLRAAEGYAYHTRYHQNTRFDFSDFSQPIPHEPAEMAHGRHHWEYDQSRFMDNMGIIAVLNADYDPEEWTIGAFVGDECRGEGIYAGDRWFITVHGNIPEQATLRIRHLPTGLVYDVAGTYDFSPLCGTYSEPIVMTCPGIDGIADISAESSAICALGSTIVGATTILDINGRDVTALNGSLSPGIYIVTSASAPRKVIVK